LLRDFADSLCAVPHDKVYGLLGLASGGMSELIVDYSKSLTELQRDLVALYNEDLRGESSNTAEVNPKMPNIVLFASFLSPSLGIYTEDMATFDFNPVFLPPAQTLLQVEATLVGVITALHSKKPYGPPSSALHFKGSWKEPGLQDDAYLGKFSFEEERSRYFVRGVVAAQRGMPLRHNEEPYIQAHERHSRHPASKTVPRDTQTQFHILHEVRWLSATNNVRGFGPDGIQAGDLIYSLQERRQKLVVRPRENGYSIVGTAHVGEWAADKKITNAGKVLISPPTYMIFYLDIMTFQLFTVLRSYV
jgi:hypothetical protein